MARRRVDQWGIAFSVTAYSQGYQWRREEFHELELDPARERLYVNTGASWRDDGVLETVQPTGSIQTRRGRDIARKAFNAFVALARDLDATGEVSEQKRLILVFANQYGVLRGNHEPLTAQQWCRESAKFLDLHDVSRAVRSGRYVEFNKSLGDWRLASDPSEVVGMSYGTNYRHGLPLKFADRHWVVRTRSSPNALPVTQPSDYDVAAAGSSRDRAIMLLANEVNDIMEGGLNFRASAVNEGKFILEPAMLVHLLYLRLWIDTVEREDLERQMLCVSCGNEIKGTRRKKFCDDRCRSAFHNKRRLGGME